MRFVPAAVTCQTPQQSGQRGRDRFGVGYLVSPLMPATDKEQHAAGAIKDQATQLKEPVKQGLSSVATEVKDNLAPAAQEAATAVKDTATSAASQDPVPASVIDVAPYPPASTPSTTATPRTPTGGGLPPL